MDMNLHEETLKIARNLIEKDPSLTDWVISKFPELRESEDERIRKELRHYLEVRQSQTNSDDEYADCNRFIKWLDKPVKNDGIENTAFSVGDWVLVEEVEGYKNGPFRISQIDELGYHIEGRRIVPLDSVHVISRWTVNDAKDGDILVASDGSVFIFSFLKDNKCSFHVALSSERDLVFNDNFDFVSADAVSSYGNGIFSEIKSDNFWEMANYVRPATEQERNMLMESIADAGYIFDFSEKKLRKIKQGLRR